MIQIKPHWIKSPGWLHAVVPQSVREELLFSMQTHGHDARSTLRGHLQEEYTLPITNEVSRFAQLLSYQYMEQFNLHPSMTGVQANYLASIIPLEKLQQKNPDFELGKLWVNYQSKHDFNPAHIHTGAFSFVIWVKIPFDYRKEQKVYPKVNGNETAAFYFSYNSTLGGQESHHINLDSDWEWSMVFFPAKMYHGVNPFYTSDEQRISISGNVYVVDK